MGSTSKIISLYCHKGGVSKTTTTFNLGWKLAQLGKKVILIDADPQCNLTAMMLGFNEISDLDKFYDSVGTGDIYSDTKNFFFGDQPLPSSLKLTKTKQENLSIVAGNLSLGDIEPQLELGLKISQAAGRLAALPGALSKIIRETATGNVADYVLIDTAPSVGALNKCLVMGADYLIIPTAPDFYSKQAIHSMGLSFNTWWKETSLFRNGSAIDGTGSCTFPIDPPKLLGYIVQNYRPRNGHPSKSFTKWIEEIAEAVSNMLCPNIKEIGMIDGNIKDTDDWCLAKFSDFNSLIALSQQYAKPIYALDDSDIGTTGHVFKNQQKSRNAFNKQFENLAQLVIRKTDSY